VEVEQLQAKCAGHFSPYIVPYLAARISQRRLVEKVGNI
jgi:hypothetical protein